MTKRESEIISDVGHEELIEKLDKLRSGDAKGGRTPVDMPDYADPELVIIDDDTTIKEVTDHGLKVRHIRDIEDSLTDKQKRFVDFYVKTKNVKQAALRAGYAASTAYNAGRVMMKNDRILALIEYKEQQIIKKLGYSKAAILHELSVIAFSNIADFLEIKSVVVDTYENDKDGNRIYKTVQEVIVKDLESIPSELVGAIKSVKQSQSGTVTLTLHDKMPAIREMAELMNYKQNEAGKTQVLNVFGETKEGEDRWDLIRRVSERRRREAKEEIDRELDEDDS